MKATPGIGLAAVLVMAAAATVAVHGQYLDQQEDSNNNNYLGRSADRWRPTQQPQHHQGRLVVTDKSGQQFVSLSPGLLEESLLKKGSFDFNSKLVKFDKLKVLGNIYVHTVNGHKLRDRYQWLKPAGPGPKLPA